MYPIAESSRFINSHAKYGLFAAVSRAFELANCGGTPLSKYGLTSAPRRPQPAQTKRGSIPERRTSSGQRSALRVQSDMMAGMAIDEDAAQAHLPHLAEGDLDGAAVNVRGRVAAGRAGHAAIETRRRPESNYQSLGSRNARELLRVVGASVPRSRRRR